MALRLIRSLEKDREDDDVDVKRAGSTPWFSHVMRSACPVDRLVISKCYVVAKQEYAAIACVVRAFISF